MALFPSQGSFDYRADFQVCLQYNLFLSLPALLRAALRREPFRRAVNGTDALASLARDESTSIKIKSRLCG